MAEDQKIPEPADAPPTKAPAAPAVEDGELSDEELGKVAGGAANIGSSGRPRLSDRLP